MAACWRRDVWATSNEYRKNVSNCKEYNRSYGKVVFQSFHYGRIAYPSTIICNFVTCAIVEINYQNETIIESRQLMNVQSVRRSLQLLIERTLIP